MLEKIARKMPCTERFLRWLLPRGIFVSLALIACIFFIGYAPRVKTGIVEYKMVTGCKEGCSHVLVLKTVSKVLTVAEDIEDDISGDSGLFIVNEEQEGRLSSSYSDIRYCISIRTPGSSNTNCLSVPREIFNSIRTNSVVKFDVRGARASRIKKMDAEIADNAIRKYGRFPEGSGWRHFMNQ
jgi:hypothetical protein